MTTRAIGISLLAIAALFNLMDVLSLACSVNPTVPPTLFHFVGFSSETSSLGEYVIMRSIIVAPWFLLYFTISRRRPIIGLIASFAALVSTFSNMIPLYHYSS